MRILFSNKRLVILHVEGRYIIFTNELELNKKHSIEVLVYRTICSTYVNRAFVKNVTYWLRTRAQLDQVNVYIGDPWSTAANAVISDIKLGHD